MGSAASSRRSRPPPHSNAYRQPEPHPQFQAQAQPQLQPQLQPQPQPQPQPHPQAQAQQPAQGFQPYSVQPQQQPQVYQQQPQQQVYQQPQPQIQVQAQQGAQTFVAIPQTGLAVNPNAPATKEYLPMHWEARVAPDGRKYYIDHSTKQTMWRPPWMPPNFEMWLDNKTRVPFYVNVSTRATQWNPPIPSGWHVAFDHRLGTPYYVDDDGTTHPHHPLNQPPSPPQLVPQQAIPTSTPIGHNSAASSADPSHATDESLKKSESGVAPPDYEKQICKVCLDREIDVVLLRCGHLCVCSICASVLNQCPICRDPISEVIKVFRA